MLDPIVFERAMLAEPDFLTTITLAINSGTEVPIARMVIPATVSGIRKVTPVNINNVNRNMK